MWRILWFCVWIASPYLNAMDIERPVTPVLPEDHQQLVIHNRILAKVNDKTISVIDVMKKMDLFLQRYYPQYMNSPAARFQYYSSQWKETLNQLVDQELILADAEQLELKISDAEVRETLLERFGPNMMAALDQIALSYEEARQMIYTEMAVQRMMWYRVNSKALNRIGPKAIKDAYFEHCEQNPPLEEWNYQVLSLRSANQNISAALAQRAANLIHTAATDLLVVSEKLKEQVNDESVSVTVSPELTANEKSIAESHKEILKTLKPGMFSEPIAQVSRVDHSIVHRIFYLKDHTIRKPLAFEKLAEQLKDHLLQQAADEESTQYLHRLRSRLGYDEHLLLESLPSDFQPFALR